MATVLSGKRIPKQSSAQVKVAADFRPDIQGLRAVAVVTVVLDHLFHWPSGGFIGVDVFFVISGYLITGLMLREHQRTGRISWLDFYRRRVKRIMPASTVVLLFTVFAAFLVYRAARFHAVADDALWAFLFASNWHFAAIGTDYLQANGPVSPLQHFWSLAVEEQFYILWPVLLIVTLSVLGRPLRVRGRSPMPLVVGSMAVIGLASVGWAVYETANNPTSAYFSTFSRGWELVVGALLATGVTFLGRIPASLRPVLSYLGLAGIAASLLLVTSSSAFPAPWAALPVVSAALVIGAGVGGTPRFVWPLTNAVSVYIGKISYSLYLWHFPVIVLLSAVMPETDPGYHFIAVVSMLALAVLSFHLVEDPARRSGWFERAETKAQLRADKRAVSTAKRRTYVLPLVAGAVAVELILATMVITRSSPAVGVQTMAASSAAASSAAADVAVVPASTPAETELSQAIDSALTASDWPELDPSLDAMGWQLKATEWVQDGCLDGDIKSISDYAANAARCVYGDAAATKTAVLYGDSIAVSYAPAIRSALESQGYQVHILTMQQCPVADVPVDQGDGSPHPQCAAFQAWAAQEIAALHPDLLILSNATNTLRRMTDVSVEQMVPAWRAAWETALDGLAGSADATVVLAPPPAGQGLTECATQLSSPSDCIAEVADLYRTQATIESEVVDSRGGSVRYVPTRNWFCSGAGKCPAFVGTTPMTADGQHLTDAYARTKLTAVMTDALLG